MFSVDNFYNFLRSHYGWERNKTLLWGFNVHGSKFLKDLEPMHEKSDYVVDPFLYHTQGGSIILHDQEIFIPHLLSTYSNEKYNQKKQDFWLNLQHIDILSRWLHTTSWPIWCHSEPGSPDVDYLESQGYIPCYYFWHGLISRDWFRHYRHHPDILEHRGSMFKYRFLLYIRAQDGTREYRKKIVEKLNPIKNSILQNWNDNNISSDFSAKIVVDDAVNSAIHIVAETIFDLDRVHATEKVFKPIVMKQPFLIFGPAGTLEYIRKYGFRTFSDLWDESYDLENDHDTRMEKVIGLIKDLNSKSDREFLNLMEKAQEIVDHNHKRFFSDGFENQILDELHTNFSAALVKQKQMMEVDPGGSYFAYGDRISKLPDCEAKCQEIDNLRDVYRYINSLDNKKGAILARNRPWLTL